MIQKCDTNEEADFWVCTTVGQAPGFGGGEAMRELVPETEDKLCIQHIHPTARMEVDPSGVHDVDEDVDFVKLYHARSAPCIKHPASTASWSPC